MGTAPTEWLKSQSISAPAPCEVDVAGVELDGHGADRVAQVPEHQCAGPVRDLGDGRHVGQSAAAVRHVGQADQRGVLGDGRPDRIGGQALVDVGRQHAELRAAGRRDSLEHMAVAGEVVLVSADHVPPRPGAQCRRGQLVQVDRGVVGDDDLSGGRAGELADQVTRAPGQVGPVIPRPGQGGAPFGPDHAVHPRHGGQRKRAQGITVEVDQRRVVQGEPRPVAAQRIRRVQFLGVRSVQDLLGHTDHPNPRGPPQYLSSGAAESSRRVARPRVPSRGAGTGRPDGRSRASARVRTVSSREPRCAVTSCCAASTILATASWISAGPWPRDSSLPSSVPNFSPRPSILAPMPSSLPSSPSRRPPSVPTLPSTEVRPWPCSPSRSSTRSIRVSSAPSLVSTATSAASATPILASVVARVLPIAPSLVSAAVRVLSIALTRSYWSSRRSSSRSSLVSSRSIRPCTSWTWPPTPVTLAARPVTLAARPSTVAVIASALWSTLAASVLKPTSARPLTAQISLSSWPVRCPSSATALSSRLNRAAAVSMLCCSLLMLCCSLDRRSSCDRKASMA